MSTLLPQSLIKSAKPTRIWPKGKRRDSSQQTAAIESLEERALFSAIAYTLMPAIPLPPVHPRIAIIAILIG